MPFTVPVGVRISARYESDVSTANLKVVIDQFDWQKIFIRIRDSLSMCHSFNASIIANKRHTSNRQSGIDYRSLF